MRGPILLALGCALFCLTEVAEASATFDPAAGESCVLVAANEDTVVAAFEADGIPAAAEGDPTSSVEHDAVSVGQDDARAAVIAGGVPPEEASLVGQREGALDAASAAAPAFLAQTDSQRQRDGEAPDEPFEEYDPWIKFNEKTFDFNYWFDRRFLKPVAKAYDKVVPDPIQLSIRNAFENVGSIRRILNALLQGRFRVAGGELGRFLFNSVVGVGGLFDVAKSELGLEQTDADTGQTFGIWGAGPGPYLVVPLLPPLTVRDAFGFVIDGLMNPISWFAPTPVSIGLTAERVVNERSLNLELFENVEETVLDLYSAVRNGYLQRRSSFIEEGRADSVFFGSR